MPHLVIAIGNQTIKRLPLQRDTYTIGRQSDCDIVLTDRTVSNQHARIIHKASAYILEDLESTNSTYVNQRAITEHWLQDGDIIQIGRHFLSYSAESNLQIQLEQLKTSPEAMDKSCKAWLEIMNGRYAGYHIGLKVSAQALTLRGDQDQLRLQTLPNAYILCRIHPNGDEQTSQLAADDVFVFENISFKLHENS